MCRLVTMPVVDEDKTELPPNLHQLLDAMCCIFQYKRYAFYARASCQSFARLGLGRGVYINRFQRRLPGGFVQCLSKYAC